MDERTALAVTAVRAVETADPERATWTDADRAWASRAAAEVVGAEASPQAFVARRATLALERLRERGHPVARLAHAWRWRPWVGGAVVGAAFVAGAAADALGGARVVDILYSPALPLVVWNLAVYALLAAGFVARYGEPSAPGPLRRAIAWLAGAVRGAGGPGREDPAGRALAAFARNWSARATPLYAARAARILHLAAAALALGVIGGLYVRGVALEFRATWESTFLDAPTVRAIAAAAYAPGAWLLGAAVPDAAHVAAIRAPDSENAAPWLHLMAATLAAVVVVPRLLLALATALVERYRAAHLREDLTDAYFARMLRGFHQGAAAVHVVAYSYALPPAAAVVLQSMLARALGGNVTVSVAPPVGYGDEDALSATAATGRDAPWIAVFNATATPEREAHGRFLAALRTRAATLIAVVDESAQNARWPGDAVRRDARRALWRETAAEHGVVPVFVDLAQPDLAAADAALDAALDAAAA